MKTKTPCLLLMLGLLCFTSANAKRKQNKTEGDPSIAFNSGYQPLDPFPISISSICLDDKTKTGLTQSQSKENLLKVLEKALDQKMKIAIGQFDANGALNFNPITSGSYKTSTYVLILDYTITTTVPYTIRYSQNADGTYNLLPGANDTNMPKEKDANGREYIQTAIPVYIGVGIRVTATITSKNGNVSFSLASIGAQADAKEIKGNIAIQTIGLSSDQITAAIPIPSDISTSTVQNILTAVGTIKSKIHDAQTEKIPRVLGFYNSVGGGQDFVMKFIGCLQQLLPAAQIEICK